VEVINNNIRHNGYDDYAIQINDNMAFGSLSIKKRRDPDIRLVERMLR
jgi:hypothetical protein